MSKTDWKTELEKMGVEFPLAPKDENIRQYTIEVSKTQSHLPEWAKATPQDSTLVDPKLRKNEEYSNAMDVLEKNLGPIGDFLFNKGVSHIVTEQQTTDFSDYGSNSFFDEEGKPVLDNIIGQWFSESKSSVSEYDDFYLTFTHEAGHALSKELVEELSSVESIEKTTEIAILAIREDLEQLPSAAYDAMRRSDSEFLQALASETPTQYFQAGVESKGSYIQDIFADEPLYGGDAKYSQMNTASELALLVQEQPELGEHFPSLTDAVEQTYPLQLLQRIGDRVSPISLLSQHPIILDAVRQDFALMNKEGYVGRNAQLSKEGAEDVNGHHYLTRLQGGEHPTLEGAAEEVFSEVFNNVMLDFDGLSAYMPNTTAEVQGITKALLGNEYDGPNIPELKDAILDVVDCEGGETLKTATGTPVVTSNDSAVCLK